MTNTSPFPMPISEEIWRMKYRYVDNAGTPQQVIHDQTVQETWTRVATALAACEKDPLFWANRFYEALEDFKFIPAGRILAGAGVDRNVTLLNCLAAETMIPTNLGMMRVEDVADLSVSVLDGNGDWIEAPMNRFGEQPVAPVVLKGGYNGRERRIVRATEGHRWVLEGQPEKTTKTLSAGDKLKHVVRRDVRHTFDYKLGVVHGIIYGDGTKSYRPEGELARFAVRLCGEKTELLNHFEAIQHRDSGSVSHPPSLEGDVLVVVEARGDYKALPTAYHNVEYITGFLRGWFSTDGCVDTRDGRSLISCGEEEAEWLQRWGAISGMEVSYKSALSQKTNFGERNKPIFNVVFSKWTMMPFDLLRSKHRKNFGDPVRYLWEVVEVGEYGDPEPVFCPRVVTTDSVQLHSGIHTGQCYVMGTIPDDMTGIFDALKEAALTMQQGGGVGMDFSTIRPSGAPVRGVGADASGPLTFMDVWDSMCRTIMSAGTRRGAMMATMRCDHPDVEAFIEAKQDPARLRMFNVSVLVTDAFMEAVKNDDEWHLKHEVKPLEWSEVYEGKFVYRTVRARDLWNKIMRSTYDYAEPGVIFIDRINRDNNLWYIEEIAATNPCGEEPLPPYGACLLGSINLTCFVDDPFGENPSINYTALSKTVEVAVRMMDNVNDVSKFPLRQQLREATQKRRIGLGITGLADMLAMMKVPYNSSHGLVLAERVAKKIAVLAYGSSVELAKEKGAFPAFDAEQYLFGENFATPLPGTFQNAIREHGIRNSHLLSIAPTGTISLYAGNVSSGIEPIFATSYKRKVTQKDGSKTEQTVRDYAVALWHEQGGGDSFGELPDYFVTAQDLHPLDHVRMQAAVQPWVDSSISKTINVPVETSFEDFEAVYLEAYEAGCKGCTTYRPNDVTGSVISVDEPPAETVSEAVDDVVPPSVPLPLRDRPDVLDGQTYKVKLGGEPAFYVTITDIMEDGARRPFEVFINTKNPEHIAWSTALTRMISAIFRRPHDSSFVVEELKNVFDPKGGGFWKGQYRPSVVAAIGQVLEDHMKAIGYIQSNLGVEALERAIEDSEAKVEAVSGVTPAMLGGQNCPKCFGFNVKRENGCAVCLDCGYSQCG